MPMLVEKCDSRSDSVKGNMELMTDKFDRRHVCCVS